MKWPRVIRAPMPARYTEQIKIQARQALSNHDRRAAWNRGDVWCAGPVIVLELIDEIERLRAMLPTARERAS